VLGAAICVAALTLVVDALLALLQRALTPRGVRLLAHERAAASRAVRAVTV
jgi:ABC-type proline/glycine betaine transport system permease subunit